MLDRITARSTECRLLLQTSWCSVVCLLVTTVNPAKRLNRSRCFLAAHSCGSEETLLGGVDIVATWRIRWIDLCDGDAGCHYYYCSNLFILPSCSNVFFSIRVLRLFGFTVFLRHSVHMISRFYVCRPSIQRSISHETAIRQYLQSGVCDQKIFLSKYAEYVWRCSVKNVSRKCDVSNKHGLWVLTNVPDKQIQ